MDSLRKSGVVSQHWISTRNFAVSEIRVQRRLAAILAADVVGYSRLMGTDESGTLLRVKALRTELLYPQVTAFGGRIVKTTGDGTLIEFASAVDAVQHAIVVQREMARRGVAEPADRRLQLRMGINVGDVIIEGDDIYGEGVNVAARLETLSDPGGICISRAVYDYVHNKLDADFEDIGPQNLKNIAYAVQVYRIVVPPPLPEKAAAEDQLIPGLASIAVLPFANMSDDPEQEYFADGMAEDIITALSRFRWFMVIARNSSFTYKGRAVDVRLAGREMGVRYILEGSVRKGGNRVRITAQLVEAATGSHLWADKYDGPLADVFDLQDKITEGVVGAIEPSIRRAEIERARRKPPDSLDAYDLYLRALPHAWSYNPDGAAKAMDLLKRALSTDPAYVAATGLLAFCHYVRCLRTGHDPAERELAIRYARTVVAADTDDALALAHTAVILVVLEQDYVAGLDAARRATSLTPNSAAVLTLSSGVNAFTGKFDEATAQAELALRLSPGDPTRCFAGLALAYTEFFRGRYAIALGAAQQALHANPSLAPAYAALAAITASAGQPDDAAAAARRLLQLDPQFKSKVFAGRFIPELREAFMRALQAAGLPD